MNYVTKICPLCKKEFYPLRRDQRHCDDCRLNRIKEVNHQGYERRKLNKLKKKDRKKTIDDIVAEMNEYNKVHGGFISYGKYVAMMENGND